MGVISIIQFIVEKLILGYTIAIILAYIILAVISAYSLMKYLRKNSFVDYNVILSSPLEVSPIV